MNGLWRARTNPLKKQSTKKFLSDFFRLEVFAVFLLATLTLASCQTIESSPQKKRLLSPFVSSVPGVSIRNTHIVAQDKGVLIRGMVPYESSEVEELKKIGVNKVLIFRSDNPGETGVSNEVQLLKLAGFKDSQVYHIPFQWKNFTEFGIPCLQTFQALKIMRETVGQKKSSLFFHCTVGEDRTGYLAALYRLVFENKDLESVYRQDMCGYGYAESDPEKPKFVSDLVHENISLHLLRMHDLIIKRKKAKKPIDIGICDEEPIDLIVARERFQKTLARIKCESTQPLAQKSGAH